MVEVMKTMGPPPKAPRTAALSGPRPAAGHCGPTPLLETPGHHAVQYATGDQWRNDSRKNEEMASKQKQSLLWM